MRLALITDIHEDLPSLKQIIRKAERKGFDRMACLGDINGFSKAFYKYPDKRDASACLRLLHEKCDFIIAGNHDLHAAGRTPVLSSVFDFPENWYELRDIERRDLSGGRIWTHEDDLEPSYSSEDIALLKELPEFAIMECEDFNILLSHYACPNLSGFEKGFYQFARDFQAHFRFMEKEGCSLSFIGHAHSKGFYRVVPGDFTQTRRRKSIYTGELTIFGLPPVTRHKQRRAFCIFDCSTLLLQEYR